MKSLVNGLSDDGRSGDNSSHDRGKNKEKESILKQTVTRPCLDDFIQLST